MLNTPSPRTSLRRGGQPRNHNARKNGTFSRFSPGLLSPDRQQLQALRLSLKNPAVSPLYIRAQALSTRDRLFHSPFTSTLEMVHASQLVVQTISIVRRVDARVTPSRCRLEALAALARQPLNWIAASCRDYGITRDADSFFPSTIKSAHNSPLPASLPDFATNLTDSQWAALAPLVPPDPQGDWLTGEPPLLIAANRWRFTLFVPTGDFQDFVVMEKYHQILRRCPTLSISPLPSGEGLGVRGLGVRGRPRTSPRLLFNAIFRKLATGHSWDSLPSCFPPMRVCRNYYRRLYRSGRWFTLLQALFNHFERESSSTLPALVEKGFFTSTPAQKIALRPQVPLTWENCTALLFMQLARSAHSHLSRVYRQDHPSCPNVPVFKGLASLTIALPAGIPLPPPYPRRLKKHSVRSIQLPSESFQPSEDSPAWQKWLKMERDQQTLAAEISRRLSSSPLPRKAPLPGCVLPSGERPGVGPPPDERFDPYG